MPSSTWLAGGFQLGRVSWVPGQPLGWTTRDAMAPWWDFVKWVSMILLFLALSVVYPHSGLYESSSWCKCLRTLQTGPASFYFRVGSRDGGIGLLSPDSKGSVYFPSSSYTTPLKLKK